MTEVSNKLILEKKTVFFLIGIMIVFAVGLFDDFHRLSPKVKFFFQIIGASVAFWGGLRIEIFSIFGINLHFATLSYLVTVFWFVLFINAVNLIDGLDGLAAGIAFFTAMVLVILSVLRGEYLIGMLFAVLAGACLGFLLLALGIPLFDTILSPIRRFVRGRKMFNPDKGHVHHRLVEMGLTTKKAVWIIYAVTFSLCIMAILVVNIRDEQAGLFLIVLGERLWCQILNSE
jgi:UDP-GlcNAc:undecaprenyl-phosphate GlcNAc-1-phosphate transferase